MRKIHAVLTPVHTPSRRHIVTSLVFTAGGLALSPFLRAEVPSRGADHETGQSPSAAAADHRTALHQDVTLPGAPARFERAILDAQQFAAFSGLAATVDPREGGAFSLFGGRIVGRDIELVAGQRIVQAWRPTHWDPGVYSLVLFAFKAQGSGTAVALDHTGFPEGDHDSLSSGWYEHYWEPLKKFLARPVLHEPLLTRPRTTSPQPLCREYRRDTSLAQSARAQSMIELPPTDSMIPAADAKSQLRKTMGFWDVLLFNIATVLGPRWIAAAGHNGASSISLWLIAAVFFFVPGALVINELSSRFPEEGGLYVWAKEAFGPFHGFVAGWTYWIYTVFYFPGLLLASASMSAYVFGAHGAALAQDRTFLLWCSLGLLAVAVALNIIGLNIGKWLQNAGGVGTCVPLLILVLVAAAIVVRHGGSATHFTVHTMMPTWDWDTVNFWSQIAFAFTGLELVSAMSEEVRDPRRTLPRAVYAAGALIALIYIAGTFAILALVPAANIDPQSGVFNAIAVGSMALKIGFLGVLAAMLVTVGNAGGVGSTVAGIARVPFVVGIDRYLPEAFGRIHSRWKTPWISILVQSGISGALLLISQINDTTRGAYQFLVDAAIILYFIPFLYMFAAVIRLGRRPDRTANSHAILVPGGQAGLWICGGLGFVVVLIGIIVSLIPPGDSSSKLGFELKLVGGTVISILIGLALYWRGARIKAAS